jgi:hypothetical protein
MSLPMAGLELLGQQLGITRISYFNGRSPDAWNTWINVAFSSISSIAKTTPLDNNFGLVAAC